MMRQTKPRPLWAPQRLDLPYTGCPYTWCPGPTITGMSSAEALPHYAYLLATSTATISSDEPTTTTSSTKSSPTKQIADPVDQTPTPSSTSTSTSIESSQPPAKITDASASIDRMSISPNKSLPTESQRTTITETPNPQNTATTYPSTATTPTVIANITVIPGSSSEYIVSSQRLLPESTITIGSGSSTTVIAMHTSSSYTIIIVDASSSIITQMSPSYTVIGS